MKPVIITLNSDNKIVMSVEEFKRHMDAAYNQGYSDGCSTSSITTQPYYDKWWYGVTAAITNCSDAKISASCLADSATADSCDCVAGHCNCSAECENQVSISSYLRNKGE